MRMMFIITLCFWFFWINLFRNLRTRHVRHLWSDYAFEIFFWNYLLFLELFSPQILRLRIIAYPLPFNSILSSVLGYYYLYYSTIYSQLEGAGLHCLYSYYIHAIQVDGCSSAAASYIKHFMRLMRRLNTRASVQN